MKVCIPVEENKGLESVAYNHFGSAPFFLVYDLDDDKMKVIDNGDLHHEHGMCQPLKALGGEHIDAILVAGIGAGALTKLNNQGVKAYKVMKGTVSDNIDLFKKNQLPEFAVSSCCSHHGGCGH